MSVNFIYLLSDPRNMEPRYVGVTNNLKHRMTDHLYFDDNTYKTCWIKSLISNNLKPIVEILEECDDNQREDAEKAWILGFKQTGAKLTNLTDGGDGTPGRKFSAEAIEKMRAAKIGNKNPFYGSRHPKSKLSDSQRRNIVMMHAQGVSCARIAKIFNVSCDAIRLTVNGKRGKSIWGIDKQWYSIRDGKLPSDIAKD
jgi:group I intron endonuclease